jgi:transcriptional regulator with XRE-family HTH domain
MAGKKKPKSREELGFNAVVGARIESLRKGAGLSIIELAVAVGVGRSQLGSWESGEYRCPPFYLSKIASELSVPVSSLIPNVRKYGKSQQAPCAAAETL